jgi:hypothetical protein
LRGVANSEETSFFSYSFIKSIAAAVLYTSFLPVILLPRHDLFMKYLIKDCVSPGKALCPVRPEDRKGKNILKAI